MIAENAFTLGRSLIAKVTQNMNRIGKCQSKFIKEVLLLILTVPNRINFLQMGRYGGMSEQSYRLNFEKDFDFVGFNTHLIESHRSGGEMILGFDPSYISKSGKCTPGLGYFYSGVESRYKRGLEIGNLCAIDLIQNTAYHIEAIQSPSAHRNELVAGKTLIDHYAECIVSVALRVEHLSRVLTVDGYFAKKKFTNAIAEKTKLEVVCRLRDDANLKYLNMEKRKNGPGRPKLYAGKVNVFKIDKRRIRSCYKDNTMEIYEGVVYSVGLQRKIKMAYTLFYGKSGKKVCHKIFFSTNLKRSGEEIVHYYRSRYQMEFVFRDAKQYAGLQHCQARSSQKLHFHFNASLTSVSIAKLIARDGADKDDEIVLSIQDVKTELYNVLLARRIFSIYGFNPKLIKNDYRFQSILNFGKIAA
jgi:hypothetical protein